MADATSVPTSSDSAIEVRCAVRACDPGREGRERPDLGRPEVLPRRAPRRHRRGDVAGRAVTVMATATPVSTSMVLAVVDEARSKNYESGVIGVRGLPDRVVTADVQ